MKAGKKRVKAQRRARRLAQQAWDAADDGQLALAIKIIRRAAEQSIAFRIDPSPWSAPSAQFNAQSIRRQRGQVLGGRFDCSLAADG